MTDEYLELLQEVLIEIEQMWKICDKNVADYILSLETTYKFVQHALKTKDRLDIFKALQKSYDILEQEDEQDEKSLASRILQAMEGGNLNENTIPKFQLKPLIKFILKEVGEHKFNTKLLDNWKQISTVKTGRMSGTRGYFIMKNGKLADASVEMEGSSGLGGGVDHYGYSLALDNRKLFGIPDELANKVLNYSSDSSAAATDEQGQPLYFQVWKYIENAILARVCTMIETSNTHKPDITVQLFRETSPKSALRLVQGWVGKQIPDAPENSQVTIEIGHGDKYISADNIREFLSAEDPRQLRTG